LGCPCELWAGGAGLSKLNLGRPVFVFLKAGVLSWMRLLRADVNSDKILRVSGFEASVLAGMWNLSQRNRHGTIQLDFIEE
jgi:hypothetical protein